TAAPSGPGTASSRTSRWRRRADGGRASTKTSWTTVRQPSSIPSARRRRVLIGHNSGIDGIWNDMNEPAVFNTPTLTMPEDNVHRGFGGGPHSQYATASSIERHQLISADSITCTAC